MPHEGIPGGARRGTRWCRPGGARRDSSRGGLSVRQGVKFTENVVADPDLTHAVEGATLLIFVLPHQASWMPPPPVPPPPPRAPPPDPGAPTTCVAASASSCC